ncbi:proton-conducting membrane transporter [Halorientalis pallida]|uniref:Proton-conducting membrane transporter n=1 Tax=Halorientalis pallida TaxID=2479928 RepID=A0A498L1B8_9EURY|nr:proton-conducting membrane transporter [Halorientalis pallida]RXK49513.1 proton-conducting membrane transporter [Halorientalis pallida]
MTTRPQLADDANWIAGVAALGLFAILAVVFVGASFGSPAGFPDVSITAGIGYAMFDLMGQTVIESEEFLVSFIVIAVALDAALDVAVMLATRDDETAGTLTDGGRSTGRGDS